MGRHAPQSKGHFVSFLYVDFSVIFRSCCPIIRRGLRVDPRDQELAKLLQDIKSEIERARETKVAVEEFEMMSEDAQKEVVSLLLTRYHSLQDKSHVGFGALQALRVRDIVEFCPQLEGLSDEVLDRRIVTTFRNDEGGYSTTLREISGACSLLRIRFKHPPLLHSASSLTFRVIPDEETARSRTAASSVRRKPAFLSSKPRSRGWTPSLRNASKCTLTNRIEALSFDPRQSQ